MKESYRRHLVTAALPYANGAIHIGHLAGVYIPADIYSRYLRLRGREVLFVCGSDEHGVPITIKARESNSTPQEIVDQYHTVIENSFKELGISFDIYSRTTSDIHHETASDFFQVLYDKGIFIERESEQYYDEEAGQFLADRYIVGQCPNCSTDGAYGDQCEKCGSTLSPEELINPKSALSGNIPIKKKTTHWYLPLDKYEPWLKEWILEGHKEWKPNVYGQCKSWLDSGLLPRAVSRDLDWGVPLPIPNSKGKVLYVWFDAPIGYISNTKELLPDSWESWWKDKETKLVHFIGKDNIVFHCIVFPTMLKAYGDNFILPDNVPANEFLNLEGDKISTSKDWAVWLHKYLEEMPGREDMLRYVLCANAPETKDNDFTWRDFQTRCNSELVGILGNFINRAVVLTDKYFDGVVPELGQLGEYENELLESLSKVKGEIERNLETYHFREALRWAINLARYGNKYLADSEPWKLAKSDMERVGTILNLSLQISANLTIALAPFLPFTVEKLKSILNTEGFDWEQLGESDLLKSGDKIGKQQLLFDRVEDSEIEFQLDKLKRAKEEAEKLENREIIEIDVEPLKEECAFEQFSAIDLRVATVLEAERVPKTDKLLKLTIDTGVDKRVIVSGIAEEYSAEEMVGKEIVIVANLAPRKIRGIESQGMILMAQEKSGKMRFITPQESVANGSVVS